MSTATSLAGGPSLGERSGGAASGAGAFVRSFHRAALVGSALLLWGLVGVVAWAFRGRVEPTTLVVAGTLPLAVLGLALFLPRRRALDAAAFSLLTLALAFAAAGHVLHPRGAALAPFFPAAPAALAALAAPLLAGWRAHALDLGLAATGRLPRALPLRALVTERPEDLLRPSYRWKRVVAGLARRLFDGLRLPGLLAVDVVLTLLARVRPGERVHLDADLDALERAFAAAGASCSFDGAALDVQLPDHGRVRVKRRQLAFPTTGPAAVLDLAGPPAATAEVRRLLETDLCHVGRFAWTMQGLRWEARLNALLRDASQASTLEERSVLLDEAQRVERLLESRDLMAEERSLLRGWKAQRLRVLLSAKLLSEPVGPRTEGRIVAPAPALAPDVGQVIDAGGLATLRRAVFVPHFVVPVRTGWGEHEVLVNALTGAPDLDAGEDVLSWARERGATLFLAVPRGAQFLPAPEPSAALLRALREAVRGADVAHATTAPDTLFVPFLPSEGGYVNGVTGARAADLGPVPGVAARPTKAESPLA